MPPSLRQRDLADCGVLARRPGREAAKAGKDAPAAGPTGLAVPATGLADALPAEAGGVAECPAAPSPSSPSPSSPSPSKRPAPDADTDAADPPAAQASPPKKPARGRRGGDGAASAAPTAARSASPPRRMRHPRAAHDVKPPAVIPDAHASHAAKKAGKPRGGGGGGGGGGRATATATTKKPAAPPPRPGRRVPLKAYRRPDGLTFPVGSYAYVALTEAGAAAVGSSSGGGHGGGGDGGAAASTAPPPATLRDRFVRGELGLVRLDAVWREHPPPAPKGGGGARKEVGASSGAAGADADAPPPPPPPPPRPAPTYRFRGGWVLPPEATRAGRGAGHGAREVFISTEASTNDAACLVAPALVVRERDFARAPGEDVYYAKYEYNAAWQSFRLIDARYADDGEDADPEAAAAAAGGGASLLALGAVATTASDPIAAALARAALAARTARAPVRPLPAPRRKGEAVAAAAGAGAGGADDGGWGGVLVSPGGGAGGPGAAGGTAASASSSSDCDGSDTDGGDGDWAPGGQRSLFDAWAKGGLRVPRTGGAALRRGPPRRLRQGGGALGGALGAKAGDIGACKAGATTADATAAATTTGPPPPPASSSALARARSALAPGAPHCGLPTREGELARLDEFVRSAAAEGGSTTGRCLYVYGVPGTGKTAAVRDAVKRAAAAARAVGGGGGGCGGGGGAARCAPLPAAALSHHPTAPTPRPFRFVEVNALRLPTPRHVYSVLVEAMDGVRLTPADAHDVLAARFGGSADAAGGGALSAKAAAAVRAAAGRGPGAGAAAAAAAADPGPATIVLVDEMDMLLTRSQAVLYNLFEWPGRPGSGLAVVGVANTMDLPDRLLPRIASRLGGRRLPFAPYTAPQLRAILETRLAGAGAADAFDPRAVLFAARKVAGAAGDVRRALELCRMAADIAAERAAEEGGGGGGDGKEGVVVTMAHVDAAARAMHGATHVQLLAACAPLDLVALVALAVEARVSGGGTGGAALGAVVARARELVALGEGGGGCGSHGSAQPVSEAEVEAALARAAAQGLVLSAGAAPVLARRFLHLALDAPLPDLVAVVRARAASDAGLAWLARVQLE